MGQLQLLVEHCLKRLAELCPCSLIPVLCAAYSLTNMPFAFHESCMHHRKSKRIMYASIPTHPDIGSDTRIPPIQSYINICLMARPEDLVLYKVMPTRDIVKCSSINMTNARLISNRKHKLPSQHKFSALSCRRADRVDSGRRLH